MSLIEHAKRELELLGNGSEFDRHILKIVEIFANEGHTRFTAHYAISLISKLLRFQLLTPLTGDHSEWNEVGEEKMKDGTIETLFQNNREGSIFKVGENGEAYTIDGKIFSDDDGETWWTNYESRVSVTFPYIPKEPERVILNAGDAQ